MRSLTIAAIGALMSSALAAAPQNPEKVTLIVKMAKGLTIAQAQAVVRGHGATPKAPIAKLDLQIIEVPANAADAVAKALKADAQIVRVEADHIRQWQSTPSDTLYPTQWALPKISWDQGLRRGQPAILHESRHLRYGCGRDAS